MWVPWGISLPMCYYQESQTCSKQSWKSPRCFYLDNMNGVIYVFEGSWSRWIHQWTAFHGLLNTVKVPGVSPHTKWPETLNRSLQRRSPAHVLGMHLDTEMCRKCFLTQKCICLLARWTEARSLDSNAWKQILSSDVTSSSRRTVTGGAQFHSH